MYLRMLRSQPMTSQPGTPTSTLSLTTYPVPGIYKPCRQIHTFFELRSVFKNRSILSKKDKTEPKNYAVEAVTVGLTLFRQHPNDFHVNTLKTLHWCDRYVAQLLARPPTTRFKYSSNLGMTSCWKTPC